MPTFREALRFWLKLGLISFGGPSGQIAIMHNELVEKKKWIEEEHFLRALNFCMLLPGPEATQLATYCGWLLHRTRGGIAAGVLFVLPSALLLWLLSFVYVTWGRVAWLGAAFDGLKPAVTGIVLAAVWRIGGRTLKSPPHWLMAAAAFVALFWLHAPFPLVLALAAAAGILIKRKATDPIKTANFIPHATPVPWVQTLRVLAVSLALWCAPVFVAGFTQGWSGTLAQQGFFFGKAALITFGGAYAVLPYVGQQAVDHHGWLTAPQMMDGLGLAETTPGPLIMVLQFVGFLGGWNQPGTLPPLAAATLGAAITTWVTFVPSFMFIFAGAPYIERLRDVAWLERALSAVTAAVVGVILNLAVWFGLHVFLPEGGGFDWLSLATAGAALACLQRFRGALVPVLLGSALVGVLRHATGW